MPWSFIHAHDASGGAAHRSQWPSGSASLNDGWNSEIAFSKLVSGLSNTEERLRKAPCAIPTPRAAMLIRAAIEDFQSID